jgi:hypothetical protein
LGLENARERERKHAPNAGDLWIKGALFLLYLLLSAAGRDGMQGRKD